MKSIWTIQGALPTFPSAVGNIKTDVLVIGGGLAGILCAERLHRSGVDYVLVEGKRIGCGVTQNTTAKVTAQHGLIFDKLIGLFGTEKAKMYLQANHAALEQYRALSKQYPCDFEEKDSCVYSTGSTAMLEKEANALLRLGASVDFLKALPLPFPVTGALRFPKQGQLHPLKLISLLAEGLHIYENTPVTAFDGSRIITPRSTITASKIIVASHFPFFNKHGSYFIKLYQSRSYVLGLASAPAVHGMYIHESGKGLSFRDYGDLLLLGGGAHRTGKPSSGWKPLIDFTKAHYPQAFIQYRWATQDCMSIDGVPYIGQYSKKTPNMYVATGFNKWGMTSSMVAASILTDLVQGKENPYSAVFSPARTVLHPQLIRNALESAGSLLTPTKPRCPHLGCALKWNPHERSWDCPCHGSRFSRDGKLLDNPAAGDLTSIPNKDT